MAVWSPVVSVVVPFAFVGLVVLISVQLTRCRIPLASSNRLYKEKQERVSLAGFAWHDANDLASSPWFGSKGAQVILCYRFFLLAIFFLVILLEFTDKVPGPSWAKFFTNWTYAGMAVHAVIGIAQSVRGVKRNAQRPESDEWSWQPFDWFDKLHAIVATSVITIHVHVAIFFWAALYDGSITASSAFKHGVNAFLIQIELWISSFPWTGPWAVFPCFYILVYAIFFWIYYAADDSWVYETLDYNKSSAPLMYFAVSFLVLFSFGICWLGAWIREKAAAKFLSKQHVVQSALDGKQDQHADVELGAIQQ